MVHPDHKDHRAILDQQDLLVIQDLKDQVDQTETQVNQVHPARLDQVVFRDQLVRPVFLVLMGKMVQRDLLVLTETKGHLGMLEHQDHSANRDHEDQMGRLVLQVPKVQLVNQVKEVPRVLQEVLDQ